MLYVESHVHLSFNFAANMVCRQGKEQLQENYLEIESERNEEPSTRWYNFYIFTHFLKAPLLCPYIILLIKIKNTKNHHT